MTKLLQSRFFIYVFEMVFTSHWFVSVTATLIVHLSVICIARFVSVQTPTVLSIILR